VLRAKVRVFVELYRKTRELEQLNSRLERRVAERTAELEASTCGSSKARRAAVWRLPRQMGPGLGPRH